MKPLVNVKRGNLIESEHWGDVAVVGQNGELLYSLGDPDFVTFFRSSAKPIQTVATLIKGVDAEYGLNEQEIAMLCGSHSGEPVHVAHARSIAGKMNIGENDIKCGPDYPINEKARDDAIRRNEPGGVFYHNCCCKHMAMIGEARLMNLETDGYYLPDNPVQRWLIEVIGRFTGLEADQIPIAVDGCGVPVHAVAVRRMAESFRRLACADFTDEKYRAACIKISSAMSHHPHLTSGTGRFDYLLSVAAAGELITKSGAEGVSCIGIPYSNVGIAMKFRDGSHRGANCVAARLIRMLSLLPPETAKKLEPLETEPMYNTRGEIIGEISAAF